MFAGASKDYRRVIFYADPNTGDRKVKVVVGIGDGRGYVDKKSFLLNGNKQKKWGGTTGKKNNIYNNIDK